MYKSPKERTHPRISVHKLASYLTATASGREKIIRDQKFPSDVQRLRYKSAEKEIRRALVGGGDIEGSLKLGARRIAAETPKSDWARQARDCSVSAVGKFAGLIDSMGLDEASFTVPLAPAIGQMIEELSVSARLLVVVSRRNKKGEEKRGAVLLVMRKEEALGEKGGKAAALTLWRGLIASGLFSKGEVDPALCIVVDVFHAQVYTAPSRGKRLQEEIKSACREIVIRWAFVGALRLA